MLGAGVPGECVLSVNDLLVLLPLAVPQESSEESSDEEGEARAMKDQDARAFNQ